MDRALLMHCPLCGVDSYGARWTPSEITKGSVCPNCMGWVSWDVLKEPVDESTGGGK